MAEPVAVVDMLNSLLDATLGSVFRFMDEGSPYLSRTTADVRRPLADMVRADQRRARELAELIDALGGVPSNGPGVRRQEQYLAYLSLKFLLPTLLREKSLQVQRYENALKSVGKNNSDVGSMLDAHICQMREELKVLEHAGAEVVAASRLEKQA